MVPPTAARRSLRLRSPVPCGVVVTSNPAPSSRTLEMQLLVSPDIDGHAGCRPRVLDRVLQRLRAAEVHRRLGLGRIAAESVGVHRRRYRGAASDRAQRVSEPGAREQRRVDPARQRANFVDRLVDVVLQSVKHLGARGILARERGGRQSQLQAQRQQPLLRTIVQIALDLLARVLLGGESARPRVREVVDRLVELVSEAVVLQRRQRIGANAQKQSTIPGQRRVVNHSDAPAAV